MVDSTVLPPPTPPAGSVAKLNRTAGAAEDPNLVFATMHGAQVGGRYHRFGRLEVFFVSDLTAEHYRGLGLEQLGQGRLQQTPIISEAFQLPRFWDAQNLLPAGYSLLSPAGPADTRESPHVDFFDFIERNSYLMQFSGGVAPLQPSPPSAVRAPEPNDTYTTPDPVQMTEALIKGLGLTYDELAAITGLARGDFFNWRHPNVTPRSASVRRLLRVYALARALINRFGSTDAAIWLRGGAPPPLDQLAAGQFEAVEDSVADLLFSESTIGREEYGAVVLEADVDVALPPFGATLERSARKPRRVDLP